MVVILLPMTAPVFADDSTADIEKRLNDLEEQVADLNKNFGRKSKHHQLMLQPIARMVSLLNQQDGNYSLKIGGYAQAVAREFADNKKEI